MPEDNPGTCVGDDAKNVAAYIYDAFYSPAARARNQPARVELSRLTVNQYANVVADLVGSFRSRPPHDDPPGLKARYITRRRKGDQVKDDPPIEQVDREDRFRFRRRRARSRAGSSPDEYEIHWHGALLAPETGEYEFNLETTNGARLWLNDNSRPLIDAWVRSGTKTEHRAVDPPARRPEVSDPRRFFQGQEGIGPHRPEMEAAARGRGSRSRPMSCDQRNSRGFRVADAVSGG